MSGRTDADVTIGTYEGNLIAYIEPDELSSGQLIRVARTRNRIYFADVQGNIYSYDPIKDRMVSLKPTESTHRSREPTILIQRKRRVRVKELIARAVFPNLEFNIAQIRRFDGDYLNNALTNIYVIVKTTVSTEVGREETRR